MTYISLSSYQRSVPSALYHVSSPAPVSLLLFTAPQHQGFFSFAQGNVTPLDNSHIFGVLASTNIFRLKDNTPPLSMSSSQSESTDPLAQRAHVEVGTRTWDGRL
jgi:hypothetical protein